MTEQISYPRPTHSLPAISIEDRFSDLEDLRGFLSARGIETKNTRIDRYQKYLRALSEIGLEKTNPNSVFKNVTDDRFQHGLDWYVYVLREVDELLHIVKGLKVFVPAGIDERLRKVVGGSDFAALDKNSESRNIQFELRIASYFCLSGFLVDLSTDTDIVASKGRHCFYIECKRVSNGKQLEENLLKARQQILSRIPLKKRFLNRCYGVIALDVTKVAYSHNGLTMGVTNDHARDVVQNALRTVSEKIQKVNFFSKKPPIIQCWLQIHIPGLIENPPQAFTRFSSLFIVNPQTAYGCKAALSLLHSATVDASLSDRREIPGQELKTSLELPAGTKLWLEPKLLEMFCGNGDHFKRIDFNSADLAALSDEIIGGIAFDGNDYNFSMLDLITLMTRRSEDFVMELCARLADEKNIEARTELLCLLFLNRYPFNKSAV